MSAFIPTTSYACPPNSVRPRKSQTSSGRNARIVRYRGEIRWVLMTADRESGNGDFIIGFIGSAIDITDRKQAEQALADLAARSNIGLPNATRRRRKWKRSSARRQKRSSSVSPTTALA